MHVRAHVYTQLDVHTQTRRCFCVCICFYLNTDDVKVKVLVTQSFLTFCDPVDYSPTGSSDHGILQARILETISFSRGSSPARNQTWVSTKPGFCLQADSLPLGHQESHLVLSTVSLGLLYCTLPPYCQLLPWGSRDYSTQWDTVVQRYSPGTSAGCECVPTPSWGSVPYKDVGRGPRGPGRLEVGGGARRPIQNSHCSQHGRRSHPTQLIYDAFSSKQAHFRSPLQGINYLKGLICITVVGQCLTRKHSGLSAVSIQGELWIFFFTLIEHFRKGGCWKTFNRLHF